MKEIAVFIGLLSGNLIAELLTTGLYMQALERSYFQGLALFAYWLCTKVIGKENDS